MSPTGDRAAVIERELLSRRSSPDVALASIPALPGVYAWWLRADARLRGIEPGDSPIYVGIAQSGSTSRATLAKRIVGQHLRGNLSGSTFRRTLAALLSDEQGWT